MSKDLTRSTATTSTTLSRKPAETLDEDTYTEAISEIIARDYFPTVASLKAQNEYLDALSSNNPEQLRLATVRLTEIATPQRKPGSLSVDLQVNTPFASYSKFVTFSFNPEDTRYNDASW